MVTVLLTLVVVVPTVVLEILNTDLVETSCPDESYLRYVIDIPHRRKYGRALQMGLAATHQSHLVGYAFLYHFLSSFLTSAIFS